MGAGTVIVCGAMPGKVTVNTICALVGTAQANTAFGGATVQTTLGSRVIVTEAVVAAGGTTTTLVTILPSQADWAQLGRGEPPQAQMMVTVVNVARRREATMLRSHLRGFMISVLG